MSHLDEHQPPPGAGSPGDEPPPDNRSLVAKMAESLGDLVDAAATTDRILAQASALRAGVIDQIRLWSEISEHAAALIGDKPAGPGWDSAELARRVIVSELATALRIPERTAENLIAQSKALLHELPATWQALNAGDISYRHAQAMIDQASSVPKENREAFEEALLPAAKTLTVSKFTWKARIARERLHPETITARHETSVLDRKVVVEPGEDGMAWLSAHLPAYKAYGIADRLTRMALPLNTPGEARTLTQLQADVFADLLVDGVTPNGVGKGVQGTVMVTVPVMTLLGKSAEPGYLEGYGPIDPDTARELAAGAPSFRRLLTHPETGAVLSVGRDRYAVPKDLRDWLRLRDQTCRFPGCQRAVAGCDIDHSVDWDAGGDTAYDNLTHLCRPHHRLKHLTAWRLTHTGGGTITWTSPSGREYPTEPETTLEPPAEPPPPF